VAAGQLFWLVRRVRGAEPRRASASQLRDSAGLQADRIRDGMPDFTDTRGGRAVPTGCDLTRSHSAVRPTRRYVRCDRDSAHVL